MAKNISKMIKEELQQELDEWEVVYSSSDTVKELRSTLAQVRKERAPPSKEPDQTQGLSGLNKSQLIARCKALNIQLTGNEVNGVLIQRIKAQVASTSEPKGSDVFNIGKHQGKTYRHIRTVYSEYCAWAETTLSESGDSCHWELKRFGRYMSRPLSPEPIPLSPKESPKVKKEQSKDSKTEALQAEVLEMRTQIKDLDQRLRQNCQQAGQFFNRPNGSGSVEPDGRRCRTCPQVDTPPTGDTGDTRLKVGRDCILDRGQGAAKRLNESAKHIILKGFVAAFLFFGDLWSVVSKGNRFGFVEICCSPNSRLTSECLRRGGSAYRMNLANGYNLTSLQDVTRAIQWIETHKPKEAWISLPCGPWSAMQNLNQRTPEQIARLNAKRKVSKRMIRLMVTIIKALISVGSKPVFEWPLRCSGWSLNEMKPILQLLPYRSRVDGCQFGMKTIDTDEVILKSWRLQCCTQEQALRVNKTCQGNHEHAPIEGSARVNATSYYPQPMVKKWMADMFKEQVNQAQRAKTRLESMHRTDVDEEIFALGKDTLVNPSPEEIEIIDQKILKIHRNAAHCSSKNLARVLKEDNAPEWVIQRALNLKCDFCLKHQQPEVKPPVSLNYEVRLWHTVGIDNAELEFSGRTVTFMLLEEEASGFCVPKVLFERPNNKHRNPTAQEVTDGFAEARLSHYPKPCRVKTDLKGPFNQQSFGSICHQMTSNTTRQPETRVSNSEEWKEQYRLLKGSQLSWQVNFQMLLASKFLHQLAVLIMS